MKEQEIVGIDMSAYTKTLSNGLKVLLVPNKTDHKKNKYYMTLGTHFGASTISFFDSKAKKQVTMPAGIAHFLEHKAFAQEDGKDPFTFFSESGCYANAYTNYKATCFVVAGTKDLKENISYLIDFLSHPYFTDENVAKERDIIKQEIRMYEDDCNYQASRRLFENMYCKIPVYYPVVGTEESVDKITKEQLYSCYNTFYQPQNMFFVMTGNFDEKEVMMILEDKFEKKEKKPLEIKVKTYKEPVEVKKELDVIYGDVKVPKIEIGYKMDRDAFPIKDDLRLDLYLNMITAISFGSTSTFSEELKRRQLTSGIGYYFKRMNNSVALIISSECSSDMVAKELIKELDQYLKNLKVEKEDLERIKKVWISSEIVRSDYADNFLDYFVDDITEYGKPVLNYIELIRSMNLKELEEVIAALDFNHRAIVKLLKEEK